MNSVDDRTKEKLDQLTNYVKYHNHRYHTLNDPEISDAEFDRAYATLVQMEKDYPAYAHPDSPTKSVGGEPSSSYVMKHPTPMYGLDNVFSFEDLETWVKRQTEEDVFVYGDLKLDGMSLNLVYENGILCHAIIRGDGEKGDIVTDKAFKIPGVMPKVSHLDKHEIRGEVTLSFMEFENVNGLRRQSRDKVYSNQRNAAAGILNADVSPFIKKLHFTAYGTTRSGYESHKEMMSDVQADGFDIPAYCYTEISDLSALTELYQSYNMKADLELPCDGLVVRLDSIALQKELGFTRHGPRFARAWKFTDGAKHTKLRDIIYQVGMTGAITPVAIFDAINIGGANITQATLHNEAYIKDKKIAIGNIISVTRSGGVIPKIENSVSRTPDTVEYVPLTKCPVCGSDLVQKSAATKVCINRSCPGILEGRFRFFVGRKGLDIKGFGPALIKSLMEKGKLQELADIFILDQKDVEDIIGTKRAEDLMTNIAVTMSEMTMADVVRSVGIPGFDVNAQELMMTLADDINELISYGKDIHLMRENKFASAATVALFSYLNDGGERELTAITAYGGAI